MTKLLMGLLLFATILWAETGYPKLYEQQGTPLYETAKQIAPLLEHSTFRKAVASYRSNAEKVMQTGYKADRERALGPAYLKALRSLQTEYDKLAFGVKRALIKAMDTDDTAVFASMAEDAFMPFFANTEFETEVLEYYKAHRSKYTIASLEQRLERFKNTVDLYNTSVREPTYVRTAVEPTPVKHKKEVIVIGTPACKYCKKAKELLRRESVSFLELDSRSGEGARLFRKNNGTGVPMILVGDEVLRGYSEKKILEALQKL